MNKQQLTEALEAVGMRPGRGLGQNFLLDNNLLDWIVRTVQIVPGEKILEVGPGFGALTNKLLGAGAAVTAVEFDHRIADYLRKKLQSENFRLIEADACRTDFTELFPPGTSFRAIANLPYAISSVFIAAMLELANPPRSMFFMLQREMGERLAAAPGTKAYGALSVRTQLKYQVKIEKIVPPTVFYPPPEVESALVSFELSPQSGLTPEQEKQLSRIVKLVFNQRRKQMGKVLCSDFPREKIESALAALNIPWEIRPDKLTVEDFVRLCSKLTTA